MVVLGVTAFGAIAACSQVSTMQGEIEGLSKIASQAERNGAIRCAPRELAMAKSHLEFATIEIGQGDFLRAKQHLELARPNSHAAYDLSPPAKCAERGFEEPPPLPTAQDPDTDGDGIVDSRDVCVLMPEDKDGYEDMDGCPEPDNDLDGIPDAVDKCPNEPEDPDGFEDADGCPDPDNDKDGVPDLEDDCPNEPGPASNKGCPLKPTLVIVTDKEIKITQQIHFEFDKDKIRPESFPILDAIVEVLQKFPKIHIEVQGHTDNKGSAGLQQVPLGSARGFGEEVPGLARHRVGPLDLPWLRPRAPVGAERHRAEPRLEPPRPVHPHRRHAALRL